MYTPKPFNEGYLPEQDGHKVYFAEYGNPDGEVIVFLHGGPGSKSGAKHAARFDLLEYRVVLFDQRGCGKSEPLGGVEENTTQKLVSDIERLRETLGFEKWFVCGSSWGSALALVYAQMHSDRVKGLLLSAIFQADKMSMDWFAGTPDGAARVYTDLWALREESIAALGISGDDVTRQLYAKICNGSQEEQLQVAALMGNWEGNALTALRAVSFSRPEELGEEDIAEAKIFLHYAANDFFLEPEEIMQNAGKIQEIKTMMVHGRHDIICLFEQAWKLHKVLPNSKLVVLPQSNHQFSPDGDVAKKMAFEAFLNECK